MNSKDDAFLMKSDPDILNDVGLDLVLMAASKFGASDIDFLTNERVVISIHGRRCFLTKKRYGSADLERITNIFYGGSNGIAHIRSGGEVDESHQIRNEGIGIEEASLFLYRVNVTSCKNGIHCTIRTISGTPPTLASLNVEKEIVDNFSPENGLVFVCGKTNSGKSTLIAASVRAKLERFDNVRKILTFEAPIEYVYDSIDRGSDMVVQHEIPRHVKTFEKAVRSALRRAPTDIVIGECRDYPTICAAVEAAETGHALFTTIHADSVSGSFYRILNMFPQGERSTKIFEIINVTRLIVAQKLVIGVNGKRVAIKEYLVFDGYVREKLRHVQSLNDAVASVAALVRERGQTMSSDAFTKYTEGKISKEVFESFEDMDRNIIDDLDLEMKI